MKPSRSKSSISDAVAAGDLFRLALQPGGVSVLLQLLHG